MDARRSKQCVDQSDCNQCFGSVLKWTIVANWFLVTVKVLGVILSGSVGLMADALESVYNIVASSVLAHSVAVSKKRGDNKYPYGYGKLEFIVALSVYSLLFGLGLFVTISSAVLLFSERSAPSVAGLPVGVIAVFVTYLQYRYNWCVALKVGNTAVMANAVNAKADMLTSVAATLGILLSQIDPSFAIFDALAALVVGLVILKDAVSHWYATLKVVIDKIPEQDYPERVRAVVAEVFSETVHVFRPKQVGAKFWIGLGLEIPEGVTLHDLERIHRNIRARLVSKVDWIQEVDFFLGKGSTHAI